MTSTTEGGAPRPQWLDELAGRAGEVSQLVPRFATAPEGARRSAVLMLFGPTAGGGLDDVDVVLTERAAALRSHPGQVSFPGGRQEPGDAFPSGTALREAQEEVGLEPGSVEVLADFPGLYLPPSNSSVVPVLAWWARPHPIGVVDRGEVERVVRVPLAELLDPARRFTVTHPSGYVGGAFDAGDLFVWGFTAMILDGLLDLAGLSVEWDRSVSRPLPDRFERMQREATGRGWGQWRPNQSADAREGERGSA